MPRKIALGLDFGTESVRALLVDINGAEWGSATAKYRHGQIIETLPGGKEKLPPRYALQHPEDWMKSAAHAVRAALKMGNCSGDEIVGIGVDFTSCTMLPTLRDGTPLCLLEKFAREPLAWPKLWKHHGAQVQADRINAVARERKEPFLERYGGAIGLEWFFPKMLETLEHAPSVFEAAEVWIEAGDWLVWQLVGGDAEAIPRSTCQAGYKGIWSAKEGYPAPAFLKAVHPRFERVVLDNMPGRLIAPGVAAGKLVPPMAKKLRLREGIPVSAAIIDAHAGVPGAGAFEAGTLVMVLGTSSCHMLNSEIERFVPGVAGIVQDGILPGWIGYETGQAAVGDAFDWLRRLAGHRNFSTLGSNAALLPPGAEGVLCLDWFNGCRTPLMDGSLTGAFTGLTLHHTSAHLYRALLEASAFGLRWIVELLRGHGVPTKKFIATGGLPHHNPLVVQVYASVLGEPIAIHPSSHGSALGAAILGALAAGAFPSPAAAIRAMAGAKAAAVVRPNLKSQSEYGRLYGQYRALAGHFAKQGVVRRIDAAGPPTPNV